MLFRSHMAHEQARRFRRFQAVAFGRAPRRDGQDGGNCRQECWMFHADSISNHAFYGNTCDGTLVTGHSPASNRNRRIRGSDTLVASSASLRRKRQECRVPDGEPSCTSFRWDAGECPVTHFALVFGGWIWHNNRSTTLRNLHNEKEKENENRKN